MTVIVISYVILQNGQQLLVSFQKKAPFSSLPLENSSNYGKFSLHLNCTKYILGLPIKWN